MNKSKLKELLSKAKYTKGRPLTKAEMQEIVFGAQQLEKFISPAKSNSRIYGISSLSGILGVQDK